MNADRLLAHYERIADSPDAVIRLRRFILDLAVRGKLVPPATEWTATSLGDLGVWGSGGTPLKTHSQYYGGDIPWLVIGDLNDSVVTKAETCITEAGLANSSARLVEPGTVLIALYGSIGKLGVTGMRCATNQAIAFCIHDETKITRDFLMLLLRSLREVLLSKGQGVAQQNISQKILKAHTVLLPSLAEQHRIVTKVDELMALCDRLETARAGREATRDRLAAASLARLNAPDPERFQDDARFALDALPALTTRPDQIKQLRQTILNLAVRGKLVPQDPNDEPTSELLKRIERERSGPQAIKTGRRNGEPEISRLRADTPLPTGWRWTNIDEIALSMRYGTSTKCEYAAPGVPVLRIPNVSDGVVSLDDIKFGPLTEGEIRDLELSAGDLLMIRSNGSLDIVGRSAIVTAEAEGMAFAGYLVRLRVSLSNIKPKYIWLALNSTDVRDQIERPIRSAVGLKNVNLTEFGALTFPLPPLTEQHRIVAKVDELMTLCDELEASLSTNEETRRRLLEALLAEALAPPERRTA